MRAAPTCSGRFQLDPDSLRRSSGIKRVLHALLRIGAGLIMISDTQPGMPLALGSNVHICLDFDDPKDMAGKFDALGSGGKVTVPLQDTFWGERFGMLTDAYGINWMFNCELKKG
ncbi:MAG: glyoxalase/bleomycin resistance/extradiol dioxygenase family protein [Deltaproteobacteria bacterium]